MTGTAIERRDHDVAVFQGATADEILAVAADAATKFGDVVKKQRMFQRIGDSDHIRIEAWQTIGALTGVVASEGEVVQIPWPQMAESIGDEPPLPGREPRHRDSDDWKVWRRADKLRRAWEVHEDKLRSRAMGRAFGFICRYTATKNGQPVGWGEGSVDRNEENWVNKDDHELRSMAETRGQSRALGAPLKFAVKLAGYETTPAEELDGASGVDNAALEASQAAAQAMGERVVALEKELAAAREALAKGGPGEVTPAMAAAVLPHGPVTEDDDLLKKAAALVEQIAGPVAVDANAFVIAMGQHFDGVAVSSLTMLRGLARFVG